MQIAHYLSNQYNCLNLPHSFFLLTDKCEFLPCQDHIVTMDKYTVIWPYIKCKHWDTEGIWSGITSLEF